MLTAQTLAAYLLCYVGRDDLDTVSKSLKLNPKEIERIDRTELRALVFQCIECRRWFHTATDRAEPTCKLCEWSLRDVSVSDDEFLRQCAIAANHYWHDRAACILLGCVRCDPVQRFRYAFRYIASLHGYHDSSVGSPKAGVPDSVGRG